MTTQYKLPPLPYEFHELEPVISAEIMMLHYSKHHQTYVNNLNNLLKLYSDAEAKEDIAAMIALQSGMKFNGGGHINHSIFWTNLQPKNKGGGEFHKGPLSEAIDAQFGSLTQFIDTFNAQTVAIQGSGWGWLGFNNATKKICIYTCDNQDPLSTKQRTPLLGIDVWEHAYYLQYKNARADYLKAIWSVVNWKNVEERFLTAQKA